MWTTPRPLALVVDDNARVRQVVSLHLAHLGFEAISLDDADEIVELASRYRPAVIVLDLVLPITDGFTAIANLRRHPETTSIPIVVISGQPQAMTRARARMDDRGGVVLLRKPFTLGELQVAVRQAMRPISHEGLEDATSR
jgi:CheY-like chemotaxis protein